MTKTQTFLAALFIAAIWTAGVVVALTDPAAFDLPGCEDAQPEGRVEEKLCGTRD